MKIWLKVHMSTWPWLIITSRSLSSILSLFSHRRREPRFVRESSFRLSTPNVSRRPCRTISVVTNRTLPKSLRQRSRMMIRPGNITSGQFIDSPYRLPALCLCCHDGCISRNVHHILKDNVTPAEVAFVCGAYFASRDYRISSIRLIVKS